MRAPAPDVDDQPAGGDPPAVVDRRKSAICGFSLNAHSGVNFVPLYRRQTITPAMVGKASFLGAVAILFLSIAHDAYCADGDLDPSFGSGGYALINWAPGDAAANSVAVDRLGRIVIAGHARPYDTNGGGDDFLLLRLTPTGLLDTTFASDGNGFRLVDFGLAGMTGPSDSIANDLVIQNDGHVVAAGCAYFNPVDSHFAAVRVDNSGVLDPAYGDNGTVHFGDGGFAAVNCANAIALDAAGNVVMAGESGYNNGSAGFQYYAAIARLTPMGQLDPGFNSGYPQEFVFWAQPPQRAQYNLAYTVGIDAANRTVVAGETDTPNPVTGAVLRLTSSGLLDTTFGQHGLVLIALLNSTASAIYVRPSGTMLVAGAGFSSGYQAIYIAKFTADGTPDSNFGTAGVTTLFAPSSSIITFIAPTRRGGWLMAGPVQRGIVLARVTANGQPDTTFGNAGLLEVPFVPDDLFQFRKPALQPDGKLVVAGYLPEAAANGNADIGVMRILADYDTLFVDGFEQQHCSSRWGNRDPRRISMASGRTRKNIRLTSAGSCCAVVRSFQVPLTR